MTKETQLYNWLRQNAIKQFQDRLFIRRIENHISGGMPDVYVCFDGVSFFIETKVAKPKISFRLRQIPWMQNHYNAGGRCFVLVQHEKYRYIIPARHVIDKLTDLTIRDLPKLALLDGSATAIDIILICKEH